LLVLRTRLACSLLALATLSGCGGAAVAEQSAKETPATPADLAKVYKNARGGTVIRLAPGDYGTFEGGRKSSAVTVRGPVDGTATMRLQLRGEQQVVIDHVTIPGAYLDAASDVTIRRSSFTGMTRVDAFERDAHILFSHNQFHAVDPCEKCYEGRLTIRGDGQPDGRAVGVTIRDNRFGPGGTADGIQVIGVAEGVRIGPGNRFAGLGQSQLQGAPHTDPIQLYGSTRTVITGNWMSGNATGIMAPDGSSGEIITNNVIQTTGYPWPIVMGGAHRNLIAHNTLPGGGSIEVDASNNGDPSSDVVVRDNTARAIVNAHGGPPVGVVQDHNLLVSGARGPHDVHGRPRFKGGAEPKSYAGYRLARSSAGRGRGSDGSDVGIP
jgi:Right handed beta helix region